MLTSKSARLGCNGSPFARRHASHLLSRSGTRPSYHRSNKITATALRPLSTNSSTLGPQPHKTADSSIFRRGGGQLNRVVCRGLKHSGNELGQKDFSSSQAPLKKSTSAKSLSTYGPLESELFKEPSGSRDLPKETADIDQNDEVSPIWGAIGEPWASILLLNFLAALYGSNCVAIKFVEDAAVVPPPSLSCAVKFTLAALAFSPVLVDYVRKPLDKSDWKLLQAGVELGCWLTAGIIAQTIGIGSGRNTISLLFAFTVVLVPMLEVFTGRRQMTGFTWLASISALVGMGLLREQGVVGFSWAIPPVEDLWGLLSSALFALQIFRAEMLCQKHDPLKLTAALLAVLAVLSMGWETWVLCHNGGGFNFLKYQLENLPWQPLAYGGLIASGVGGWLELNGLRNVHASTATLIYTTIPIWGAFFSFYARHETLNEPGAILGAGLIFAASAFAGLLQPRKDTKAPQESRPEAHPVHNCVEPQIVEESNLSSVASTHLDADENGLENDPDSPKPQVNSDTLPAAYLTTQLKMPFYANQAQGILGKMGVSAGISATASSGVVSGGATSAGAAGAGVTAGTSAVATTAATTAPVAATSATTAATAAAPAATAHIAAGVAAASGGVTSAVAPVVGVAPAASATATGAAATGASLAATGATGATGAAAAATGATAAATGASVAATGAGAAASAAATGGSLAAAAAPAVVAAATAPTVAVTAPTVAVTAPTVAATAGSLAAATAPTVAATAGGVAAATAGGVAAATAGGVAAATVPSVAATAGSMVAATAGSVAAATAGNVAAATAGSVAAATAGTTAAATAGTLAAATAPPVVATVAPAAVGAAITGTLAAATSVGSSMTAGATAATGVATAATGVATAATAGAHTTACALGATSSGLLTAGTSTAFLTAANEVVGGVVAGLGSPTGRTVLATANKMGGFKDVVAEAAGAAGSVVAHAAAESAPVGMVEGGGVAEGATHSGVVEKGAELWKATNAPTMVQNAKLAVEAAASNITDTMAAVQPAVQQSMQDLAKVVEAAPENAQDLVSHLHDSSAMLLSSASESLGVLSSIPPEDTEHHVRHTVLATLPSGDMFAHKLLEMLPPSGVDVSMAIGLPAVLLGSLFFAREVARLAGTARRS